MMGRVIIWGVKDEVIEFKETFYTVTQKIIRYVRI